MYSSETYIHNTVFTFTTNVGFVFYFIFLNYSFTILFLAALGLCCFAFPDSSVGKESACNAGDLSSIPGSGRSPGEGNGNPLQYPCLGNPMDRGAWQAIVHGVAKSYT